MNKVELEAKVDALTDELNFLRALYDAVQTPPPLISVLLPPRAREEVSAAGTEPCVLPHRSWLSSARKCPTLLSFCQWTTTGTWTSAAS